MAHYLDTSALVKLVVVEPETNALRMWLIDTAAEWVSSDLARTELMRAVRRAASDELVQARALLDSVTLLEVTTSMFEEAGRLDPQILRPLDALHLAAALHLGDDLEAMVTYDERLTAAANANGVETLAPE